MTTVLREAVAAAIHPALDEGTENYTVPWDVIMEAPEGFPGTLEIVYAVTDAAINAVLYGLIAECEERADTAVDLGTLTVADGWAMAARMLRAKRAEVQP